MTTYSTTRMQRLRAILALRCPRCCRGSVFGKPLETRDACPVCGLVFEREPGYFVGAMYASYGLGLVITTPIWLTLLLTEKPLWVILVAALVPLAILMPVLFHYSRVLWLHWDYHFNPGTFVDSVPRGT